MLAASKAGYNMIFAVGFLNYNALNAVAPKFPKLRYAGIDEAYALFSKKPKNAAGVVFAEHEAGYLVGYLAGLEAKKERCQHHQRRGREQRARDRPYISGYIQGAKKANPRIKVLDELRERPDLLRSGEVQGDGARPDPAGHKGRLPGGRRLRPRRALGGEGERGSGASVWTPTSASSART